MSKEDVKTRIEGGILEVIVDRPKANAIDRATSMAYRGSARRIARVVPPVPGPSSTTVCASRMAARSTIRRSKKRELGITEPTS